MCPPINTTSTQVPCPSKNPTALGAAFPRGSHQGVATAAYQVEGALTTDGRGESNWDRYLRAPGRVVDGSDGSLGADHYHRWREDIAIMSALGLSALSFLLVLVAHPAQR